VRTRAPTQLGFELVKRSIREIVLGHMLIVGSGSGTRNAQSTRGQDTPLSRNRRSLSRARARSG
jgi:hypothetical protein